MFIDSVELTLSSGKGGAGSRSFRREKFTPEGGPDGGDGGNGGNVYFIVDKNTHTLSSFRGNKHLKAKNGEQGYSSRMHGKAGESLEIIVPPGTQVIDKDSGEIIFDLMEDSKKVLLIEGGRGGAGNWHFRSSTNQAPTYAQPGLPGQTKNIRLELKLIADVGLVGFPNVGKSTLISTISNATPEVANYEFTTLTPKLGVVDVDMFSSFVMADIPGIIEGASEGRGLGLEFLKHIERTSFLLFMIDLANYRPLDVQYETLKDELQKFAPSLSQRNFAIALTRVDAIEVQEANEKITIFLENLALKHQQSTSFSFLKEYSFWSQDIYEYDRALPLFVVPISSVAQININPLKYALMEAVKYEKNSR